MCIVPQQNTINDNKLHKTEQYFDQRISAVIISVNKNGEAEMKISHDVIWLWVRFTNRGFSNSPISKWTLGFGQRFWSYISSRRCDNNGVAPLRNTDGLIYSDAKSKADILNNQFSSVFTQEPKDNLPDLGTMQHTPRNDTNHHQRGWC